MKAWEQSIADRELADKRRRAPGWLDSEQHLLQPNKQSEKDREQVSLMDEPAPAMIEESDKRERTAEDMGAAMDRAFGRSEMG